MADEIEYISGAFFYFEAEQLKKPVLVKRISGISMKMPSVATDGPIGVVKDAKTQTQTAPSSVEFSEITIECSAAAQDTQLFDWYEACRATALSGGKTESMKKLSTGTISIYNPAGEVKGEFTLTDLMPTKYSFSDLDVNTDSHVMETVTLGFTYLERTK